MTMFQAAVYGKCVAVKPSVKKDDCLQQFKMLSECTKKQVRLRGTTGVYLLYIGLTSHSFV